jgi:hypothetical protein
MAPWVRPRRAWRTISACAFVACLFPLQASMAQSNPATAAPRKPPPVPTPYQVRIVAPIPTQQPTPSPELFFKTEAFWVFVGSLGSFLAAAATVALAFYTSRLAFRTKDLAEETSTSIADTQKAMAAEDRRHRDTLQPHVAIIAEELQPGIWHMFLWNIGPGYAKDINITATMPTGTKAMNIPVALPANGRIAYYRTSGTIVFPSDITIRYQDSFGNNFVSQVIGQFAPGTPYVFKAE